MADMMTEVSVPALAYLGDSVMELLVRERLVKGGLSHSAALNRAALAYVTATAQAGAAERLLPYLTATEESYYRRGRNSGHLNFPKTAKPAEYRMASGLETLFGYLHLSGQTARARELFALAYPTTGGPSGTSKEKEHPNP